MTDIDQQAEATPAANMPKGLFALSLLYGGMTVLAGVLGAKQVALGPLAVEAGIFAFLLLVSLSSAVAELYGRPTADRLVRFGFIPLVTAIILSWLVIQLPTDEGMYEPAKEAFPIILGQSWRLMAAGVIAYGVSMSLNVAIFSRLSRGATKLVAVRAAIASVAQPDRGHADLHHRRISSASARSGELILGQAISKVVLSIVLVPFIIMLLVGIGRKLDERNA